MQPLEKFPGEARAGIRGVFADIDDTITTDGRLTPDAYGAMARIQDAGLLMIPITGRPAGWCDHIARMWPVDGVVGENGAFYFRYDHQRRTFQRRFVVSDEEAEENRKRLKQVAAQILAQVPGCALASDQPYRLADIAIDFCEDVPRLEPEAIQAIVSIMEGEGLTAKVSSIHVNGWLGDYDKLTMTRTLMTECFSTDIDAEREAFVFVGDSPNDQPMFEFFPNAIGVANLKNFTADLLHTPTYITKGIGGAGFAEVADLLVS